MLETDVSDFDNPIHSVVVVLCETRVFGFFVSNAPEGPFVDWQNGRAEMVRSEIALFSSPKLRWRRRPRVRRSTGGDGAGR